MRRREFLTRVGGFAAGSLLARSLWWPVTAKALTGQSAGNGRILVVITLQGGNDGLNTVVPYTDGLYYAARPTLAVPQPSVLTLDSDTGLHPNLSALMPHWNNGHLAVVREVGYPDMNLSHFRGTDIIFSGSDSHEVISTGWLGRWLETQYPDFPGTLPQNPMALQQGFSAQLPLQGPKGVTGVVVFDPSTFAYLVNSTYSGGLSDAVPATPGGDELSFVRGVDVASFQYANEIETASDNGTNTVPYPQTDLGNQLEIIARLIDGQLDTPVYLSAIGGFDTHAQQPGVHPQLMTELSEAIAAFLADVANLGRADDVAVLTVSEFGRRVEENGSDGTDHGTAAPWFVVGNGITGGIYGPPPALDALDPYGNLPTGVDYRSIYATLLYGWFGSNPDCVNSVLGGPHQMLGFLSEGLAADPVGDPALTRLLAPTPNPARGTRTVRFQLAQRGPVRLEAFDVRGRRVALLAEGLREAGPHAVTWDATGVASGIYFLRLEAAGERHTQKALVR